jgi:hypothetical protein
MSGSYTPLPPSASMSCSVTALHFGKGLKAYGIDARVVEPLNQRSLRLLYKVTVDVSPFLLVSL